MILPANGEFVMTSESVTSGHPDKVADQIADAILDAHLERDPSARVACEVLVTSGAVVIAGEVGSAAAVPVESIVRSTIRELGYDRPELGFWDGGVIVIDRLRAQSREIAKAVTGDGKDLGAGDQGVMVGFACDETEELMPMPIVLAHAITRRLSEARTAGEIPWLRPDGKAQVSVRYEDGRPAEVTALVVSCQHEGGMSHREIEEAVTELVIRPALDGRIDLAAEPLINPSGSFITGGPAADTGLTGRKLAVDTYGCAVPHGGGAFSGKDPTKVDRSGAYAARQAAKAIVAAGLARRALVQLAYAIGRAEPVAVSVATRCTGRTPDDELARVLAEAMDFRPAAIIERLGLRRPIYRPTAAFGHFGRREPGFSWERVDGIARSLGAGNL